MDSVEIWLTIGVLIVATAIARSSFWLIGHHITIPKRVQEMLRYAPACALAAIIAPDLFMVGESDPVVSLMNPKLIAGVAATLYCLWRKSMLETIIVGMAVFTALRIWLE
ncbi:AzlD domain-containing protein [Massilia sp. PAMC28688]|uniref:AzlD domain-containing protein n=1 Tax=Massilia sp. PAMC28688 TaxID=2861283 RepID=UPI001C632576|nr:AzlD domain-containing protein [Massilia sp. PAMC28688]QYF95685.1 AzlD domain-containing protein [Massilia sp. PAMC28688]